MKTYTSRHHPASYLLPLSGLALLLGSAPSVRAQGAGTGTFDGLPFGFSVSEGAPLPGTGAPGARGGDIRQKWPGVHTGSPIPDLGNMGASHGGLGLDAASLFPFLAPGPYPDIDAISFGVDYIPSTPTGVLLDLSLPTPSGIRWGAVAFSVTGDTSAVSGPILTEAARPETASGDVFTYLLPGSGKVLSQWDTTILSVDSTEISVHPPGAPTAADAVELDGLDVYTTFYPMHDFIPFYITPFNPLFPAPYGHPVLFFSVTSASAAAGLAPWDPAASGATVYRVEALPIPGGWIWTPPVVHFTPAALGLGAFEEIDALAYDIPQGFIIFSTKTPGRNPFLFISFLTSSDAVGPPPVILRAPSGVPLSIKVGLGPYPDDVDAVCALDPRYQHPCQPDTRSYLLDRLMGVGETQEKSGATPPSMKMYLEQGAFRLILRDSPANYFNVLLVSPSTNTFDFLGAQVLVPLGFMVTSFWQSGIQVQQKVYPYTPTQPCGPVAVQTVGVKLDFSASYGSEVLLIDVGF